MFIQLNRFPIFYFYVNLYVNEGLYIFAHLHCASAVYVMALYLSVHKLGDLKMAERIFGIRGYSWLSLHCVG